jgi:glycosyltransferase involved in cell wall biosynthesis
MGKIRALNGVSTVLKNLKYGFDTHSHWQLEIYSLDCDGKIPTSLLSNNTVKEVKNKNWISHLKKTIHSFFNKYLNKNVYLAGLLYAWLAYERNAKKVIKLHGEKVKESDILFFQELFTPYYFMINHADLWACKHKILVLHSNGEVWKMFFEKIPIIAKHKKSKNRYTEIGNKILEEVNAIIFLSNEAKNRFESLYPQYSKKVHVVPNGLIETKIKQTLPLIPPSDKIKIVTVGTVCERKGHDIIVDTIINLSSPIRDRIEIYVIGDGPLLNVLKEKCNVNNIRNIYFVGPSREVNRYLSGADVFLLASRDEGLPMAIIEALRCKLPIIGTNVGGIPAMIKNKENGWLIEPTVFDLTYVFQELIKDETNFSDMGKKSYEIFKRNYSINTMIEGYCTVFENVLKR